MPFDALTRGTLTETANLAGIVPIPADELAAHKAEAVRKHPGSWCYHHRGLTILLVTAGFLAAAIGFCGGVIAAFSGLLNAHPWGALIPASIAVVSAGYFYAMGRTEVLTKGLVVQGPAYWQEMTHYWVTDAVPESIATMAIRMRETVRGSTIVIGTLRQNSITLDPYLVIRRDDDEIVLGIWDDTGIIRQAEMR